MIVRNLQARTQTNLVGHAGNVTCFHVSPDGLLVASGERTKPGSLASVILWKIDEATALHKLTIHKLTIASVAISPSSSYLVSLGGIEDGNQLVIWDISTGSPITGVQAHSELVSSLSFYHTSDCDIITVGKDHIRHWRLDESIKKLSFDQVSTGSLKRTFTTVSIAPDDSVAYCGSSTGDFIEVDLSKYSQRRMGPAKSPSVLFGKGITCSQLIPGGGDLLLGSGDGHLIKVALNTFRVICRAQVSGAITSISFTSDGTHFFACTDLSNVYWVETETLKFEIRASSHTAPITSLAFPSGTSDVLASSGGSEIRLWNCKSKHELLSIQVPQVVCNCVAFMKDGKSIISGWSDGKIRAFTPQSGKLIYAINDAHKDGVTAITAYSDCSRIVSGGFHGEVRVWKIAKSFQQMEKSLKEHKSHVSRIDMRDSDSPDIVRAVSASHDGSCIVWDLIAGVRILCVFEETNFRSVAYCSDYSQFVTIGGTNIIYWDVFDNGHPLRTIEDESDGADAEIATLAMASNHFVIGTSSGAVKVYHYDQGDCVGENQYTGASVTSSAIAPNKMFIVTGNADGSICFWAITQLGGPETF